MSGDDEINALIRVSSATQNVKLSRRKEFLDLLQKPTIELKSLNVTLDVALAALPVRGGAWTTRYFISPVILLTSLGAASFFDLSNAPWSARSSASLSNFALPKTLINNSATVDPISSLVLVGGSTESGDSQQTWSWTKTSWIEFCGGFPL